MWSCRLAYTLDIVSLNLLFRALSLGPACCCPLFPAPNCGIIAAKRLLYFRFKAILLPGSAGNRKIWRILPQMLSICGKISIQA